MDDLFESTMALVESAIREFGVDPGAVRVDGTSIARSDPAQALKDHDVQASWTLTRGSAFVLISVATRSGEKAVYLRVVCPVMTLPSVDKRLALFQRLLELNASGLVNSAFGLLADRAVVVSERPAQGLDASEVEQIIKHTSAVADTYDDRLVKEFGGRRATDASDPEAGASTK